MAETAAEKTKTAVIATKVISEPVPDPVAEAPSAPALRSFPVLNADAIRHAFESGKYPYAHRLATKAYEEEKARLQTELLKVQIWAQETGQKFVILFEGRDAA
ncbi:MAG: polyphosphate kinase 2, partial [Rhodobacteraceae bacterium]|nr:polyphosphate kinase 2 [Paracoccaceae bacterium]